MKPSSHAFREMDSIVDPVIKEELLKDADMYTETREETLVAEDRIILAQREVAKEEFQSEAEGGSDREIKYVNTQDFIDIEETVIRKPISAGTSSSSRGITIIKATKIAKKKNNSRRKERKPCNCNVCKMTRFAEKQFKCKECDYQSKFSNSLKRHAEIHTTEKPYRCEVCDYRSKRLEHLKLHSMLHTEEKLYRCELCDYRCRRPEYLRRHTRIHTFANPYRCDVCGYQCRSERHLKLHTKTHTTKTHNQIKSITTEKS